MVKEKQIWKEEEIESIKKIIDDKDLMSDGEKEKIKSLMSESISKDISLGRLFARCYNSLLMIQDSLFDEDEDFRVKIKDYIEWFKENTSADNVHSFIMDLERADGGIGSFFFEGKIITRVTMHRKDYLDFVSFFGKVVGLED